MNNLVVIRGAGDLASGIIQKLYHVGYPILALELEKPLCIRRQVSFGEAIYTKETMVEGIRGMHILSMEEFSPENVNVLIDQTAKVLDSIKPKYFIDATLCKKNIGLRMDMADFVIGVGPPFVAGEDCHVVIETNRGHNLGRLIYEGAAFPNTKIPGNINGYTHERVIYAQSTGYLRQMKQIGDLVTMGEVVAYIVINGSPRKELPSEDLVPVYAKISGFLRGILREGSIVTEGLKIADVDPRLDELHNSFTISDKARNIAGGVLEAILRFERNGLDG